MGQALYRKYRSKSLGEIVGQEHITDTLDKAIQSGRISHAYLFSGPRGSGKTSIARILAHRLNDFPYTDDAAYLDIIEIDAASNRRIDEIRELRDKVYIAPTSGKYKVYIIDEVHMLTREAFNALLKTLEEPPAHAVFILATTEAHKLPDTIVSRTQHYTFKPVETAKVVQHLAHIAEQEHISITPEALEILAKHGQGSFRDSISLLDQAGSCGTAVDADTVRALLGIAPDAAITQLLSQLQQGQQPGAVLSCLSDLYGQGLQATSLASQLAARLRQALSEGQPLLAIDQSLRLLRSLIDVPTSPHPERLLEIVLLESLPGKTIATVPAAALQTPPVVATLQVAVQQPPPSQSAPTPKLAKADPAPTVEPQATKTPAQPPTPPLAAAEDPAPAPVVPSIPSAAMQPLDAQVWPQVLNGIKTQYNTLYGVLRMANPIFSADSIELQFKFAFHQKRLNEVKNKQIIADFIKQVTGQDMAVVCTINKAAEAPDIPTGQTPAAAQPAALASISDIFGGGEMIN